MANNAENKSPEIIQKFGQRFGQEFDNEFPRAILHVDGDAFFVACEVACNPALRGKPVVTGADRRIASALSYEAKALGVKRGMPIYEIRRSFPQVIIIPSHYRLYEIFSQRMYRILQRFTPAVEWYSIDECFADLTGLNKTTASNAISYEGIARQIKEALWAELGISFSVGLSTSKVLAKVASKWQKPDGLTIIPLSAISKYLKNLPLGKIWGIGPQTTRYLSQFGVQTAGDFMGKSESWLRDNCGKNVVEIWHELSGRSLYDVHSGRREKHKSLSSTETFMPPTSDPTFIFSELSRHVEDVARSARMENLAATHVSFFLKTRDFRYRRAECALPSPTALPGVLLEAVRKSFGSIHDPGLVYRATGVTIFGLVPISHVSQDLFGGLNDNNDNTGPIRGDFQKNYQKNQSTQKVYEVIDSIISRYGSRVLSLCSSLQSLSRHRKKEKMFSIPILGKVT